MNYICIQSEQELNMLTTKTAKYANLNFKFSDKYIKYLKDNLLEPKALQLLAKTQADEFLGYIASVEKDFWPNYIWILELFVDPTHQRKKIGTNLLKKVMSHAKQQNLKGMIAETEFTNIPAQNLYKKMGFKQIPNPNFQNGITFQFTFEKNTL